MERRASESTTERRTVARGGRRDGDQSKPWYLRRPLLLTVASLVFVGWQRVWRRAGN
jgi:hypothetical protein